MLSAAMKRANQPTFGSCTRSNRILLQEFLMTCLFGFNLSLLAVCWAIREAKGSKKLLIWTSLLFAVTVIQIGAYMDCYFIAMDDSADHYRPGLTAFINGLVALEAVIADLFMTYRCFVVWNKSRYQAHIIALPILLLAASIAMAGVFLHYNLSKNYVLLKAYFAAFVSLSVSINILISVLIAYRIWFIRRKVGDALDMAQHRVTSHVIAILVESVALYTITGIIIVATLFRNVAVEHIMEPLYGQAACTASLLLMIRIRLGISDAQEDATQHTRPRPISQDFEMGRRTKPSDDTLDDIP